MERDQERGAVSVEYVVVGMALLVLLTVLATTSAVGDRLVAGAGYNICRAASLVTGSVCEPPAAVPGNSGYNGQTPLEQATDGDYVALGDSYSSGEGADDYLGDTDDDKTWGPFDDHENVCHRSGNAYPGTVYNNNEFNGAYVFGACSGGVMSDYYENNHGGNDGEGPQRDNITDDTSLVTISMGGNDFGFADVISGCITAAAWNDCFEDPDSSTPENEALEAKKAEIHELIFGDPDNPDARSLLKMYDDMRADAGPDARLLIVGYPQLFPDLEDVTNGGDSGIAPNEQDALNQLAAFVNAELAAAAQQSGANVEYVDVSDALAGHEIGTDDPWINDLDVSFSDPGPSTGSFHPNAEGQNAMAAIVQEYLEKGRPR